MCYYLRDYYIVEFPKEIDKYGTVSMGVVPYTWLIQNTNNTIDCLWPLHLKGNSEFVKAVIGKINFARKDCKLCPINVKF